MGSRPIEVLLGSLLQTLENVIFSMKKAQIVSHTYFMPPELSLGNHLHVPHTAELAPAYTFRHCFGKF